MPGLLDFIGTPEGQGLLSAAFSGLAVAGNRKPINTLGAAGLAGLSGYSSAQDQQQRLKSASLANSLTQMQYDQLKHQQDQQDYIEKAAQSAYRPGLTADQNAMALTAQNGGPVGPTVQAANLAGSTPATPGGFDSKAFIDSLYQKYPMIAMDMQQKAKQAGRVTLKKDEVVYDDSTGKPVYSNVTPEIKDGYIVQDGNGGFSVDPNLFKFAKDLKATGAPKVNVSPVIQTGTTFGKGVAEAGANQLMAQIDAARSAPQSIDSAQQIINALDTKNVMSGPGTKWKITASQLFGANQDSLNATRATIQGLAKLSLASRQSLRGQGQITDAEQKMLANAASGNIDDLSNDEIRLIANGAIKNAGYVYNQGRVASDALSKMPEVQGILPALQLPDLPRQNQQSAQAPSRMVTLSDIAATARASGKSTAQVTADLRAAGYKMQGDK